MKNRNVISIRLKKGDENILDNMNLSPKDIFYIGLNEYIQKTPYSSRDKINELENEKVQLMEEAGKKWSLIDEQQEKIKEDIGRVHKEVLKLLPSYMNFIRIDHENSFHRLKPEQFIKERSHSHNLIPWFFDNHQISISHSELQFVMDGNRDE